MSSEVVTALIGSSVVAALVTAVMNRKSTAEVEKLKATFEHGRLVTKAQLDVELAAYQDVWAQIASFVVGVRSFIAIPELTGKVFKTVEEDLEHRLQWYANQFRDLIPINNRLVNATRKHEPFMSDQIAKKVMSFSHFSSNFTTDCMTDKGGLVLSQEWMELRAAWHEETLKKSNEIAALIRERLADLRVLG